MQAFRLLTEAKHWTKPFVLQVGLNAIYIAV